MNIDEFKASISTTVSAHGCSAEFYFLFQNDGKIIVKSVDINDDDHLELERQFLSSISDNILLNDDLTLISLSSADDRKSAVYQYDLDEIPIELSYLKMLIENENFDSFDHKHDDLSKLKGILILLGNHDSQLALYKYQYPVTLLKKENGIKNQMQMEFITAKNKL